MRCVGIRAASSPLQPAFADGDHADFTTTESGLRYKVTKEGTGKVPEAGMTVSAHYTGWLDDFDSIKKFDSSRHGRVFFSCFSGHIALFSPFLDLPTLDRKSQSITFIN